MEDIVILSDDVTHDAHAVHAFCIKAFQHLVTEQGLAIARVIQFSDGCAAQYKSKVPFADVAQSVQSVGFQCERHYYGSRHGKGPADGTGGWLKTAARNAVAADTASIQNANDLKVFCSQLPPLEPLIKGGMWKWRNNINKRNQI